MAFKDVEHMSIAELKREVEELRAEIARRDTQAFKHNLESRQSAGTGSIAIGDGETKDA